MNEKISYTRLVLIVLLVNVIGFLLRFFEYPTYFILFGFRFHLVLVLPYILFYKTEYLSASKNLMAHPVYRGKFLPFLIVFIPLLVFAILFYLDFVKLNDPEYFYEFGLSSIFDFPVYLLFNFPQLVLLILFLDFVSYGTKYRFSVTALFSIFIFAFEFIPIAGEFKYFDVTSLVLAGIITGLFIKYLNNIYWLSFLLFSIFWSHFLIFGISNQMIVNILYAANYNSWEGFFITAGPIKDFVLIIHLGLVLLVTVVFIPLFKKKQSTASSILE